MFDFDASKLLIVGVIALIFIPPKDLPRVLRQVGQFVGKMRRMAGEFQGQFMDAMREADMADLRAEARKLADAAKVDVGLNAVTDLGHHLTGAIEGKPVMMESAQSPVDPARSPDASPEHPRQSVSEAQVGDGFGPPSTAGEGLGLAHAEAPVADGARTAMAHRGESGVDAPAMSSSV